MNIDLPPSLSNNKLLKKYKMMGNYRESGFVLPSSAETNGFDSWTSEKLASYFSKNDLGQYSQTIVKHKINGRLASMLTDDHFKEISNFRKVIYVNNEK